MSAESPGGHGADSGRFLRTGHLPTLIAAFLYFDLAFMVWLILGPLAPLIAESLALSPADIGLLVATPPLAGALLRVPAGILGDRYGPRRVAIAGQGVVIAALAIGWQAPIASLPALLALGTLLGVAGASFAVALPLAGRWYPPRHQGTALGIAAMGNSGTVIAALVAPGLAVAFGWQTVFGLACLPLIVGLIAFVVLAKEPPRPARPQTASSYRKLLRTADCWRLMAYYVVTFGGFVGLAASLPVYFTTRFGFDPVAAGQWSAGCVLVGSLVRPLGGRVADRIGGTRALAVALAVAAGALAGVAIAPGLWLALILLALAMLALGSGNGALFQLVPHRFGDTPGAATGLIGMAGGIGGFFLAMSLGIARQLFGDPAWGFAIFALLAVAALVSLLHIAPIWRRDWQADANI